MAIIKSILNRDSFVEKVDFLKATKRDFRIESTGYTKSLIIGQQKFTSVPKNTGSPMVFPCFNKIKTDVIKSNIILDKVPYTDISYFSIGKFVMKLNSELPEKVIYIDIRSAYLSCLLNIGLITKETFDYVNKQEKFVRLKSVGMLATQKVIYEFKKGELIGNPEFKSDPNLRNVFFFLCMEIGRIMSQIADVLNKDFLFFWVDGIYLKDGAPYEKCLNILRQAGYSYKQMTLENCLFISSGRYLNFSYHCGVDAEGKEKRKVFNIPFENKKEKEDLKKFMKALEDEKKFKI